MYSPVQVITSPGASADAGHEIAEAASRLSLSATSCSVIAPVFVTTYENPTRAPTAVNRPVVTSTRSASAGTPPPGAIALDGGDSSGTPSGPTA